MPSVRRVLCWAQDMTVNKPHPCSQDACAELLTPPEVPPTLVPGMMKLFAESFPRSQSNLTRNILFTYFDQSASLIVQSLFQIYLLCKTCPRS